MKTIVCYGDSNTWGFMPKAELPDWSNNRYDENTRWTGIAQKALGSGYRVEEEGLNGRTTVFNDPFDKRRNGLEYIETCLLTKMPVDLVILMLGTNDVKEYIGASAFLIAKGIGMLIEKIQGGGYGPMGKAPEILVISPVKLGEGIRETWLGHEFGSGCLEKAAKLGKYCRQVCMDHGTRFMDAAELIQVSALDCVHIDADAHEKLGKRVAQEVRHILNS